MKSSKIKCILLVFSILFATFNTNSLINSHTPKESIIEPHAFENWTLMLYFCADTRSHYVTSDLNNSANGLYIDMLATFNTLKDYIDPASDNYINVIALFDDAWTEQEPYGNAEMYEIKGNTKIFLADLNETNMGDQQTLEDFITFCKTNYPANYYGLSLIDHGRGYAGFCYDYHAPHPYWPYALGDCLTVSEIDSALQNTGGVDVLFLDTCSGGSFEVAWQFIDEVDYLIAGESIQRNNALYHSTEIVYNLSRNVNYTPYQLANCGFDCAKFIQVAPWDYTGQWKSISFYDLTKFDLMDSPHTIQEVFSNFTDALIAELNYNYSTYRELFTLIRNESTVAVSLFSTESMMIDLFIFVNKVFEYRNLFHFNDTISQITQELLILLTPSIGYPIVKEWSHPWYDEIYGFSICLPDSYDMYQGYLYPNFYENLDISIATQWDEFIKRLYPQLDFNMNQFEFWEFQLNLIDPSVSLHVFIDQDPIKDPIHIGLNEFSDFGMGIELGLPGAEFCDDLLFGNSMIRIPSSSLSDILVKASNQEIIFTVVVNATAAASDSMDVNLTVLHVKDQYVVWKANKIKEFSRGQTLICKVSTNEEITDFEIIDSPFETEHTILGLPLKWFLTTTVGGTVLLLAIIFMTSVIIRKRKRK